MAKPASPGSVTVGDNGRVTLSADLRTKLGIKEGDTLLAELTDHGTIELVPVALIPKDQVWFAHPEMQARIAEAHADIAAGRTTAIRSAEELEAYLSSLGTGRGD